MLDLRYLDNKNESLRNEIILLKKEIEKGSK
jgi:hypothetical protein